MNGFSFGSVVQKRTGKNQGLFQLITTMWTTPPKIQQNAKYERRGDGSLGSVPCPQRRSFRIIRAVYLRLKARDMNP